MIITTHKSCPAKRLLKISEYEEENRTHHYTLYECFGFISSKRKQTEAKSSAGDTTEDSFLRLKVRAHTTKNILQKESQLHFLALVTQTCKLEQKLLLKYIKKKKNKPTRKPHHTRLFKKKMRIFKGTALTPSWCAC